MCVNVLVGHTKQKICARFAKMLVTLKKWCNMKMEGGKERYTISR